MVGRLDDIHSLIRETNGLIGGFSRSRDVETDTSAHHDLLAVYLLWLGQDTFQAQGKLRQPFGLDALSADGEFIASEASNAILWTQLGTHSVSRVKKDLVPGVMAEGVVDGFEAVEVDVEHTHVSFRPLPVRLRAQGLMQLLGKLHAIAQSREGIVGRPMG
jgi:hypothetical protein